MGMLQTAVFSGISVGPLLGGVLADTLGIRSSFLVSAALAAAAGLAVHLLVHEDLTAKKAQHELSSTVPTPSLRLVFASHLLLSALGLRMSVRTAVRMLNPVLPLIVLSLFSPGRDAAMTTGVRGEIVTYAIVDAMNGYDAIPGADGQVLKNRVQIRRPGNRAVFLDEGRLSPASWTVHYDQENWWDQITARHGDGTNLSFADGHGEYYKWKDPRTIEIAEMKYDYWQLTGRFGNLAYSPGNEDLHKVQRAVWGKLGYTPSP